MWLLGKLGSTSSSARNARWQCGVRGEPSTATQRAGRRVDGAGGDGDAHHAQAKLKADEEARKAAEAQQRAENGNNEEEDKKDSSSDDEQE